MPRVSAAHKESRKEQIIAAAGRCFARSGYAATGMQQILQESGLSAGAVYSYFKGKLDIYMAVMEHDLQTDLGRYAVAAERAGSPWERLHLLVEMYMASFADPDQTEFSRVYLLEFLPSSLSNPELGQALRKRNEHLHAMFRAVLDEGVGSGQFRPLDSGAVAALILAAGDGVRLHALTVGSLAEARKMYLTFVQNLKVVVSPA